MLADLINVANMLRLRSKVRGLSAERYAVITLTAAATVSGLLYWLTFVQPYHLMIWQDVSHLDLRRVALAQPNAPWLLLAAFIELGLVYALAARAAAAAPHSRAAWGVVISGAVALGGVLLFLFPFDATDIFDNILHGRMIALYDANPFVQVIAQFARDPIRPYVGWPTTPSAYGPLWETLAGYTAWLTIHLLPNGAGHGVIANVIAFKLLGGLFLAGSGWLTAAILRRVAPERALAGVLLLTWNPVVLYETLGNGHNDIAMLFFVLAAVWLMLERRYALAVAALMAGALVKFLPLLLIPAAVLIALRDLPTVRARLRFLFGAAVLSAVLAAALYAPFWEGRATLGIDRRERLYTTSPAAMAYVKLRPAWGQAAASKTISQTLASLAAAAAVAMALRAYRDRSWASFARSSFYTLTFYLLVAVPWFQNWYTLWPLGLAVLLPPGYAARLGHVFNFSALAKPLLAAPFLLWPIPTPPLEWRELRLAPAALAVAWLYALYGMWAARRRKTASESPQPRPDA